MYKDGKQDGAKNAMAFQQGISQYDFFFLWYFLHVHKQNLNLPYDYIILLVF